MADVNAELDLFHAAQVLSQRADRMQMLASSVSPSLARDMVEEISAMRLGVRELLKGDAQRKIAEQTGGEMYQR